MKNELKISIVSIVCVLCVSGMSGAYGASSVRTLGGTGTYTSAASASQSGGSTGVARAGSVRVTPTTAVKANTTKPTTSASTTAGRTATTSRLSLGKYLGGGTAISGGSSTRPGNGSSTTNPGNPGLSADVSNRLEQLEDQVDDLKSANEDLKESMQNKLTGDGYIEIDKDGNISLIVDNLKDDLIGIDGNDGREVLIDVGIGKDGKKHIQWKYDGDTQWTDLIAIDELKGEPGSGNDVDWTLYSTTEEMNDAISKALGKVDDTYSKEELDEKLEPVTSFEEKMEELTQTVEDNSQGLQDLQETITVINQTVETVNNFITEEGNLSIEENSITSAEIAPDTITNAEIAPDTITNAEIAPGTITSAEIAEDAITNYELAPEAVELTHLSEEVAGQLVGAPEEEPNGMYVLLVAPNGERVWADLVMSDDEAKAMSGDNN